MIIPSAAGIGNDAVRSARRFEVQSRGAPGPPETASSGRVLIIDQQSRVRELLCDLVKMMGYDVDGAHDAAEGVALFAQGGYELIVTPLALPGMTGWEVAEAVRQQRPSVRVILIGESATEPEVERAQERGLILVTPFSFKEMRTVVRQALPARVP